MEIEEVMSTKLIELIEKFETVAPNIWDIMVRQVVVEGAINLVVTIVCLLLLLAVKPLWKLAEVPERDMVPAAIVLGFFAVIPAAFGLANLLRGLARLLNPEYHAIKLLMDLV